MERASFCTCVEVSMPGSGKTIKNMDWGMRYSLMGINTRDPMLMENLKASEYLQVCRNPMRVSGATVFDRVGASGRIVSSKFMRVNGYKVRPQVRVICSILQGRSTRDNF